MVDYKLAPGEYIEAIPTTAKFRGEEYAYTRLHIVDTKGYTWTTTGLDESNTNQVYNQYRVKHGIPFPADIIGMREHYGVSAAMMSRIMGFGANQWRRYEDGEVPNESNARAIIAAAEVKTFLRFLEMASADIEENKREKIRQEAVKAGDFAISRPSLCSGYTVFDPAKCAAVVREIISLIGETFVTKANKLLFYIDFLNYKRTGFGMTGLGYKAVQYGPIPRNYMAVYGALQGVGKEERMIAYGGGTVLTLDEEATPYTLTESEKGCIAEVCAKFKDSTSVGISEYSHREEAWRNHRATHGYIPYSEAFSLSLD